MRFLCVISFLALLFAGCFKDRKSSNVEFNCIKLSDTTLYVKISNKSESDIYIPSQYIGNYTAGHDSIYLEGFSNPKYDTTWYYKYRDLLPFPIYLNRKILGIEPDSVFSLIDVIHYNQFRVQPFINVKKNSSYLSKVNFNVPCNGQVAKIVYYKKDFFKDETNKNGDYLLADFEAFERQHAKKEVCQIYRAFLR